MSKFLYLFIYSLLSVSFWNLAFIKRYFDNDIFLVLSLIWSLLAFFFFKKPQNVVLNSTKYKKYVYFLFIGVFLSLLNAKITWDQPMLITFFSQRYFYSFIFLFSLFYIQPSIKEIEETLKWISILTIFIWIVSIFDNSIIYVPKESLKIFLHLKKAQGNLDFGMAIGGYELVFFYYCFRVNSLIKKYSFSVLCQVLLLVTFFLLYQNRSMLIGVFLIFSYMIVKMRSYYKPVILVVLGCMIVVVFFYTLDLLQGMISESQHQLNDSNYNRWKAFYYYLGDYHPNIWGYFFGSGISGVGSHLMSVTISNRLRGIYASDVGMIGMWANYGIIPILVLYSMVLKILFKRKYPLFLKFLSFHILVVPTIYQFWMNPGILLFCLFIYLYAYSTELNKSYL